MTSPTEIPEALKAKALNLFDTLPIMPLASEPWCLAQIEAFALQVRNEAIAEEREQCARVAETAGRWPVGAGDGGTYIVGTAQDAASAIRARP